MHAATFSAKDNVPETKTQHFMPAKVFISCGQNDDTERLVAREVATWLKSQGYEPYVAVQVQTIPDLNKGIIEELKRSDYYLLINFRRELMSQGSGDPVFRGSLYTNQELAIAYAIGFDDMVLLSQRFIECRGMLGTIVANSPEFDRLTEVLPAVENAVKASRWSPDFSRHLVLEEAGWSSPVNFPDHAVWDGQTQNRRQASILIARLRNKRKDFGASSTVARLTGFSGEDGADIPFADRSNLKVTSQLRAFSQTIWPGSDGRFDLLALDCQNSSRAFLPSNHDASPRQPIIRSHGVYRLDYQVLAVGFPMLEFSLKLTINGSPSPPVEVLK